MTPTDRVALAAELESEALMYGEDGPRLAEGWPAFQAAYVKHGELLRRAAAALREPNARAAVISFASYMDQYCGTSLAMAGEEQPSIVAKRWLETWAALRASEGGTTP